MSLIPHFFVLLQQRLRERAAPQQFERARLRSACTVLAENSRVMADIQAEYLACPIRTVVSRFGDKWSMLVLYQLHVSETGILRFNEIRGLMTDCSQKMLSQTLKNLEQSHLVHREVYPEVPPRGGVFPNRYRQIIDACPHSPHRLG